MNIKPITLQDAEEAYNIVKDNGNPSQGDKTYHKELCRFDDGKALYFCAGTLYDGDEFEHYCKLGIENPHAVLADFEFDYPMPWDPNNEYGDVIDTELSLPISQDDVEWLNKEAIDIAKGYENGELVASACGKKKGKKKPVKSAKRPIQNSCRISSSKSQGLLFDCERILDDYGADYRGGHVEDINGTKYIVFKYYGGTNDTVDRNDDSWDEMYELDGVADVGYGNGYGNRVKGTNYHNNTDCLLIELEDGIDEGIQSSRHPIQSMYVTQDISGNDLYACLWSGGKDQFDSMIEDGADADDILNACEELLFREEGNPPTMTELNDLIWFEPDTIREYIGLSNPIESGCHGKSKKGKGKKKAVKSAKKSIKSAYNPYSGEGEFFVNIDVVEDGEHSSPKFSNDVMWLDDFIQECKGYAESCNGYYYVSDNGTNQYLIEFKTGDDSFTDNPGTDPYYEESCGKVVIELIYPYNQEMADYIENGGY